jgi:uncharacterized iron-regulated membrane protein
MQSILFLKFGALASSLLLGAAFVAYRAGAIEWSRQSDRDAVDPPTPPAAQSGVSEAPRQAEAAPAPPTAPTTPAVPDRAFFAGSKSAAVFVESPAASAPALTAPPQAATPDQPAVIMSGSKSLMPAVPRQKAAQSFQKAGKR